MNDKYKEQHLYDDIIQLPHHVSSVHPPMSLHDRAAQFSPFAALTGYHEAVDEAARFTDEKRELDEHMKTVLDETLRVMQEHAESLGEITVTYFLADAKKSGGSYVTVSGFVKKIDFHKRILVMDDNTSIPIDDIMGVNSSVGEPSI